MKRKINPYIKINDKYELNIMRTGIYSAALLFVIGAFLVIFVWRPWLDKNEYQLTGEAEAVMTTKIIVRDGLWDPTRYTDEFYYPKGIALLDGKIVVADYMCDRIQIIDGDKNIRIGMPGQYGLSYYDSGAFIDGYRENAMFMKPVDVSVANDGTLIVADSGNHVIRRITDEFVITIAGNGRAGFNDGREGEVQFNNPRSAIMSPDGYIYVVDTLNHVIRRIDDEGNVTVFAGVPGVSGYSDGNVNEALFFEPHGICIDPNGVLYIADSANHAIRKIENGAVSTVAGRPGEINRLTGYPEGDYLDGINSEATFNFPRDVVFININQNSYIFVADSMNHAVRAITSTETFTIVGNGMADQFYASAENLRMTEPSGVATNGESLFISDTSNNRILEVPLNERIMAGRPSRKQLLADTGLTTDSHYAYTGDIRVFIGDQRIDMGRVAPWNTADNIFVPIRPLFEALGASVIIDERTNNLTVSVHDQNTVLKRDTDYFILRGVAVTTVDEIERLFPYVIEWFPEFSLITLHIPVDLR